MNDINDDWQLECTAIRSRGAHILKTGEFSDCTFMVGSEQVKISAHKIILAMSSPVYRAMFYGSVADTDSVISIVDITADVFKLLLVYVYTDEIIINSFEEAYELYYAAQKYMLPYLTQQCVKYLSSILCAENALPIYEFAKFNDDEFLMDRCLQVICEQAKGVLKASSFTEASLETVCMIFSMDPLDIDSELDLFAAAERYLEANKECAAPPVDNSFVLSDTNAPSQVRAESTVQNVGYVETYRSPPYYVRNLPFDVIANSKSTCWTCYGAFLVRALSHKPDINTLGTNSDQLFHSKQIGWGCNEIVHSNELLDPEKGDMKDGSITVEPYFEYETPDDVLENSVEYTSSVDHRDKLTIRNAVRLIRFLTLTPAQFADRATNSTLLDKSEEAAILINLVSTTPRVPMPKGFCSALQNRERL